MGSQLIQIPSDAATGQKPVKYQVKPGQTHSVFFGKESISMAHLDLAIFPHSLFQKHSRAIKLCILFSPWHIPFLGPKSASGWDFYISKNLQGLTFAFYNRHSFCWCLTAPYHYPAPNVLVFENSNMVTLIQVWALIRPSKNIGLL